MKTFKSLLFSVRVGHVEKDCMEEEYDKEGCVYGYDEWMRS